MLFQPYRSGLHGEIDVPGDKSISHRSIMLGALSEGLTSVTHFLKGADCLSTIDCFKRMGIDIEDTGSEILIHGKGLHGLRESMTELDTGNSGTTTRLISGILAGQAFTTQLNGDASIQKRPMGRIIEPLSSMGADITSVRGNGCAPLLIKPSTLHGISYRTKVASAQVKSSILLAGLYADAPTSVTEPAYSRNHTELMLNGFGGRVDFDPDTLTSTVYPEPKLIGQSVPVPGDISSAAYFLAAGCIVPGSEVLVKNVGTNPTRDGMLRVMKAMGADMTYVNEREAGGEPVADVLVRYSNLKATVIEGDIIPTLIDELPIIAIMACFAEGTTIIRDAAELKVKESNRIDAMVEGITAMGGVITGTDDGMIIEGGHPLCGGLIDSRLDHRIAMSFAVASLAAEGETEIKDADCVKISYPEFYSDLHSLMK